MEDPQYHIAELNRLIDAGVVSRKEVIDQLSNSTQDQPKRGRPSKLLSWKMELKDGTVYDVLPISAQRRMARETPFTLEVGEYYVTLREAKDKHAMVKTLRKYPKLEDSTVRKYAGIYRSWREVDQYSEPMDDE